MQKSDLTRTILSFGLAWALVLSYICSASAEVIYLKNGDRVTGKIVEEKDNNLKVQSILFGEIVLPRENIDRVDQELSLQKKEEPSHNSWKGSFSVSYATVSGNSHSRNAMVGFNAHRKSGHSEWDTQNEWAYGSDNRKMVTQKFYSKTKNDLSFELAPKWFWTRAVEASHDRFNNVDVRTVPSSGLGYRFWDDERKVASMDLSLGYEYTDYREGAKNDGVWVLVPHAYFSKRLMGGLKVAQDITFYPSLEETDHYRLRSVSSLSCPINNVLSWKLSLTDEFNSSPKGEAKKNDSTLLASLEYAF